MTHYIHDEKNNRIEGMSKEEIYALIDEVIATGELPTDTQAAFVTALKSIVDGNAYKIGFCTQAEYNQLEAQGELEANALYIITDDTTEQDIEAALEDLDERATALEARVTTAENDIDNIETQVTANTTNISTINSKISYAKLYKHDILFGNNSTYTTKCCFTLYNTRSTEITFGILSAYIPSNRPINVGGYKVEDSGTQHLLYPITHLEYDGISTYYIYYIKNDSYYREALQSSAGYSDNVTPIFNLSEV